MADVHIIVYDCNYQRGHFLIQYRGYRAGSNPAYEGSHFAYRTIERWSARKQAPVAERLVIRSRFNILTKPICDAIEHHHIMQNQLPVGGKWVAFNAHEPVIIE